MGRIQSGLKKLYVPLGVIAAVCTALSWYYFGWVASERDYFRKRDFRQLATLSEQIRQKVDNFDSVMDHFVLQTRSLTSEGKTLYLKNICPDLEYRQEDELPEDVRALEGHDPPDLSVERDEGKYCLFFTLKISRPVSQNKASTADFKSTKALHTRSDVGKLIAPFTVPLRNSFEALLVARRDGTVIFQQSQPGIEVAYLDGLAAARAGEKLDVKALGKAAGSLEVRLAGTKYTLYSQPIRLSYPSARSLGTSSDRAPSTSTWTGKGNDDRTQRATAPAGTELEDWIVCGLVRSDRFARDSLAISSTLVIGFGFALLLVICLSPFIKLSLLRANERLRARDCVLLAASTFLCAALLTFVALDTYYYGFRFHAESDQQLMNFAQCMQANLKQEEEKIWAQLNSFDSDDSDSSFRKDFNAIRVSKEGRATGGGTPGAASCHRKEINGKDAFVCERTDILEKPAAGSSKASIYPYLDMVVWDDSEGRQRIKWTPQKRVTPFLSLPESNIPYYQDLRNEFAWSEKDFPNKASGQQDNATRAGGVGLLYSVNTGKNIAVFWRVERPGPANSLSNSKGGAARKQNQLLSVSLITRPVSLIGPVLPANLQFAVVNQDGQVLFHSDASKNLIENFFEECDQNSKLRSLVAGRASALLYVNYLGRRHHLYVCPLAHYTGGFTTLKAEPAWSLVVFKDMRPQETMNLECLSASSMLFLFCAGIIAIAWALMHAVWRKYPRKWFWPNEEKAAAYRLVVIMNALVSALFLFFILRAPPAAFVVAGFLLPVFALTLTFLLVNWEGKSDASGRFAPAWRWLCVFVSHTERSGWKAAHLWARTSLLIVIAVLPCFSFFRATFEFEKMLLINRGQIELLRSLHERQERVRGEYSSVALSEKNEKRVLAQPDDNPWASYHTAFFSTALIRGDGPAWGTGWFGGRLQHLLAELRPRYNDVAAETEAMILAAGGGQEDGKYALAFNNDTHQLTLTRCAQDRNGRLMVRSQWESSRLGWDDWRWWFGLATFLTVLFLFVRIAGEKIFLLDLYKLVRPDPTKLDTSISMNLLVMGLPLSGKTRALTQRAATRKDVCRLDLAEVAVREDWADTFPYEKLADQPGVAIALDHFEYGAADDPAGDARKLHFLEDLVYKHQRTVLLVSATDPLHPVANGGGGSSNKHPQAPPNQKVSANGFMPTKGRWSAVLSSFVRRDFQVQSPEEDEEFSWAVAKLERRIAPGLSEEAKRKIVGFFQAECGPTPRLRAIGEEFVSRLRDGVEISPEFITCEMREQAEAYYSLLWATLSKVEKLVLAQLAHEGLVNPKNSRLVAQLMRKGLIVRDPAFRLINQSFTQFVAAALPSHKLGEWEKEGIPLPWSTLRFVLLAAVASLGIFLYVTQQSLFESVAAYVAAIAAAIPALIKFVGMLQHDTASK